jgi:ABC-type uncharacterized transport system YnjBCD substrate-binding protein
MVQANPVIKQDPKSKMTNAKMTGRMAEVIEHLPHKDKAPNSKEPAKKIEANAENNNYKSMTMSFCV